MGSPLDAGRRIARLGTEDRISILRQYGLLPPLAAAGISQEE